MKRRGFLAGLAAAVAAPFVHARLAQASAQIVDCLPVPEPKPTVVAITKFDTPIRLEPNDTMVIEYTITADFKEDEHCRVEVKRDVYDSGQAFKVAELQPGERIKSMYITPYAGSHAEKAYGITFSDPSLNLHFNELH